MDTGLAETLGLIDGMTVPPLKVIGDHRGAVLHMLRADSQWFRGFGEIYFSKILPGIVKAWKRHLRMFQHFTVPVGRVRFAFYDNRPESSTAGRTVEIELGRPDDYKLLIVPPKVWCGFQGLGTTPSLIANRANLPHDPSESELVNPGSGLVPYEW